MNARAFAMTAMAVLSAAACVQTKAALLNPTAQPYPVVSPDSVMIFTSEKELDTLDYVRVAIIEATGSGEWTSQTGMTEAMRKKAGALGANAILLPQINEPAFPVTGVGIESRRE